mgnify:CR=1
MHALTLFVLFNTLVTEILINQSVRINNTWIQLLIYNSNFTYDKYQATTMMVLIRPFELIKA